MEARIMMPEHSFVSYIVGLLFGLGLVIYALYSIKRGSVIWRGRGYLDRQQAPLRFWINIVVYLVLGGLIVVTCVMAFGTAGAF